MVAGTRLAYLSPAHVPSGPASLAVEPGLTLSFALFDISFSHFFLRPPGVLPLKYGFSCYFHGKPIRTSYISSSSAGGPYISALKLRFCKIYNFRESWLATVYKCFEIANKYPVAPASNLFTNS